MEKSIKIREIPWDKFFEQATEDISTYLWTVERWSNPPEGYTQGYLLIMSLSHRARGRSALALMDVQLPSEYAKYKDRVAGLWSKAESIFKKTILTDLLQLEYILRGEMIQRLDDLENCLKEVQHIAQDGDLLEEAERVAPDLQEAAKDFLLRFQDIAFMKEGLEQLSLKDTEGYKLFKEKFDKVNDLFRQYFGYFHIIRDTFENLKTREYVEYGAGYDAEFWWFKDTPKSEDVKEEEIPEAVMEKLRQAFQTSGAECPDGKEIFAYALGELEPGESQRIKHHILKCRICRDLITDVYLAEGRIEEPPPPTEPNKPQPYFPIQDVQTRTELENRFSLFSSILKEFIDKSFIINLNLVKLGKVPSIGIGLTRDKPATIKEFEIEEGAVLKSGDYFWIRFSIDRDAYLYVLFQDSTGKISKLFSGRITDRETHTLPTDPLPEKGWQLDSNIGIETVCLLASEEPIDEIDSKIKELEKMGIDKVRKLFPEASYQLFEIKHE